MPVTVPNASTEPFAGLLLVQLPPGVISVRDTDAPMHIDAAPVIAVIGFTVTIAVVWQPVAIP